jgi:hypothetical protein
LKVAKGCWLLLRRWLGRRGSSPAAGNTRARGFEIAVVEAELEAELVAEPGAEG